MRRRISIRGCVRPSLRRSVRPSPVIFKRVLGASFAVYPALFSLSSDPHGDKVGEMRSASLETESSYQVSLIK